MISDKRFCGCLGTYNRRNGKKCHRISVGPKRTEEIKWTFVTWVLA